MGRKLDALLGRNFKTSKFKTLAKLAISRIYILKKQHQVRYSQARSDVIELLNLDHQQRALLRVEHVIKEHNMVDAFNIMESYCHFLIERVMLIQKNKECPDELKEATSSLMFASSRCGEFPELLHIRGILSLTFGKEFVARAIELRNNCNVHPKIIQKLSTRQPSLESKLKVLKEIADEKDITLHIESEVLEAKSVVNEKQDESISGKSAKMLDDPDQEKDDDYGFPREITKFDENLSESIKARKNYRDVAAAAQEAFESAAYAAAAARAAVELSRAQPQDSDSDSNESGSEDAMPDFSIPGHAVSEGNAIDKLRLRSGALHESCSESDEQDMEKANNYNDGIDEETKTKLLNLERIFSSSSSDSDVSISTDEKKQNQDLCVVGAVNTTNGEKENDAINEDESKLEYQSSKLNFDEELHSQHSHIINKKWVSVRTRRGN